MVSVDLRERGTALEAGYYTLDGLLFDRSDPDPEAIMYMLDHDSQAAALELGITLPLQSARFDIEEGPNDSGETELVRKCLLAPPMEGGMTTPLPLVISQMSSAVSIMRVYFEKVFKQNDDGSVTYHKVAWRPPLSCTIKIDRNGTFNGFRQLGVHQDGKPLDETFDPQKAFVYVHRSERRPLIGHSAFQTAFGDYEDKLKAARLHNIHLQNFALGTVVAKYSGSRDGAAKRLYNKIKKFMGGGGQIVLGEAEEVDFISRSGAGEEFLAKLKYLDAQMAGSVLLRFLQLGTDSHTGSWALSRDHSDFFLQSLESILRDISDHINNFLIATLVEINFGKDASYPRFVFQPLAETSMQLALEVWEKLVLAANRPQGAFWDAIEEKAAQRLDIPLRRLQEEEPDQEQDPLALPSDGNPGGLEKSLQELFSGPAGSSNGNGSGAQGE